MDRSSFNFTSGWVQLRIWSSVEDFKEEKLPILIINCLPEFMSNAFSFVRSTFQENYVCVIINDA